MVIKSYLLSVHVKAAPVNSTTWAIAAKMSSYKHRTSCLKTSAKLEDTDIFFNEDARPATQSIRKAKMGELQVARQRGLIAYFSRTTLFT